MVEIDPLRHDAALYHDARLKLPEPNFQMHAKGTTIIGKDDLASVTVAAA